MFHSIILCFVIDWVGAITVLINLLNYTDMTTTDDIVMEDVTREYDTTDGVEDVEMVEEVSEKTTEASSFTPESIPGPSSSGNFQGIYLIIF